MKVFTRIAALIGLGILLSGCSYSPTFLNPASPISGHEANLYKIILYMALVVFVLVEGALITILVRDRKKQGDREPAHQIYGNNTLEVVWTAIPVALAIFLFVLTVNTVKAVAAPEPAKSDVNVHVIGHRWWWEFDYPDLGIKTANELHIPVDANVQITLDSIDVIHSFWIPQLSGKTDAIPGQTNHMWLKGDQVGEFFGQCAEFCGTEHALMRIKVVVQSREDFDAWVANQQKVAAVPQTESEQEGYKIVTSVCASCHSINPGETKDMIGPNLTHLFSRSVFAGATYDLNEANVRLWLQDTQKMKPGNDMVLKLQPDEIDQVISYLKLLK